MARRSVPKRGEPTYAFRYGKRPSPDESAAEARVNNWSKSQSRSATSLFASKRLWVWPLVAAMVLAALAWWLRASIEATLRESLVSQLQTVLEADVTALDLWFKSQESTAEAVAGDPEIRAAIVQTVAAAQGVENAELRTELARSIRQIRSEMQSYLDAHEYEGFVIIDAEKRIIVSSHDELIGQSIPAPYEAFYPTALKGRPMVTQPFRSTITLRDAEGNLRAGVPTMFAIAPVTDAAGKTLVLLALRIRPEIDFTRILSVARMGETGEVYACAPSGVMLSESRFDDQLKELGLLPDREDARSILEMQLRNPQVDLTRGERTTRRRADQPLTAPAAGIAAGQSGQDVQGYRDYRGVPTIGAWKFLPARGFGVVAELDEAEGLRPLRAVRAAFWSLLALLLLASIAIFTYTVRVAQLERSARKAARELKRLGQYVLENKIGAGGMGAVYRARHAMLRRPTAIKLIDPEQTNDVSIARFEREVQLTSQLNHPNTIAIYDYGRTPEGVFYYAMELLDGLTLQALVERFGPQPEGRVVQVLKQICGSLSEAHNAGLIHRDIKPANIMLCVVGGLYDFVKLLDFGLVKAVDSQQQMFTTMNQGLTGTPLYMPPEAIEEAELVDRRSDLYALGAVGYFLLTGEPVFEGKTIMEICRHHLDTSPQPPSERLGRPIAPDLEALVLRCLAKSRDARPGDAREMSRQLEACRIEAPWTEADAEGWWKRYQHSTTAATEVPTHSQQHEATVDFSSQPSD
jgi:eukaryotic-like serine/threonine-protein kinase